MKSCSGWADFRWPVDQKRIHLVVAVFRLCWICHSQRSVDAAGISHATVRRADAELQADGHLGVSQA